MKQFGKELKNLRTRKRRKKIPRRNQKLRARKKRPKKLRTRKNPRTKKRRRKNSRRWNGVRQTMTSLRVLDVEGIEE